MGPKSVDDILAAVASQADTPKYAAGRPKMLVDDVHKVYIDEMAGMPDLDPRAVYHVTHPKWAKSIIESGVMRPSVHPKWGGAAANNSAGRVFFTAEPGVGRWVDIIGNQMSHLLDNPPEKLAVLQFRDPNMDFQEAMAKRLYELPIGPEDIAAGGRPMPVQDWAPRLWQDAVGSRDGGANAFFALGEVPVYATPRVRRIVSRYSVLAPLAAPALSDPQQ
jgi:hypothetical protein